MFRTAIGIIGWLGLAASCVVVIAKLTLSREQVVEYYGDRNLDSAFIVMGFSLLLIAASKALSALVRIQKKLDQGG